MKRIFFCFTLILTSSALLLAQAPISNDAYTNSSFPNTNFGSHIVLSVGPTSKTYLRFNLSGLPAATTGSHVAKATLKLWVNPVGSGGSLDVYRVDGEWAEKTITAANTPPLGAGVVAGVPVPLSSRNNFTLIDLTDLVKDWLDGEPNNGIALSSSSGSTIAVLLDSKENIITSHEPELLIVLASQGTQGAPGQDGEDGQDGQNGLNGLNGVSVSSETLAVGSADCPTGGSKFTSASGVTLACNGAQGPQGPAGAGAVMYQVACINGTSGFTFPICCRINSRNGQTSCRVAQDWNAASWISGPSDPFGAAADGNYTLSCWAGVSGQNFPTCCRSDAAGNVTCRAANNFSLSSWGTVGTAF
jgi:hypothetical protein